MATRSSWRRPSVTRRRPSTSSYHKMAPPSTRSMERWVCDVAVFVVVLTTLVRSLPFPFSATSWRCCQRLILYCRIKSCEIQDGLIGSKKGTKGESGGHKASNKKSITWNRYITDTDWLGASETWRKMSLKNSGRQTLWSSVSVNQTRFPRRIIQGGSREWLGVLCTVDLGVYSIRLRP